MRRGLLILLGLAALAVLIVSLDEIEEGRVKTVDVAAELPESEGLAAGAAVWIAGYQVGEVVSVALLPPAGGDGNGDGDGSRIVATVRLPADHLRLLRTDSRAHLTAASLMGDAILEFSPGSVHAPRLTAGDTIPAAYGPDQMKLALGTARGVLVELDTLAQRLRHIAGLYRERRPMLDELSRSIEVASAGLDRTARSLEEGPLPAALADARLGERFDRVRAALARIEQGLGRYSTGVLGENVAGAQARADSLRAEIALLDSAAADVSGFLGRFQADSAIGVATGRASAQMDSLAREVMSNPLKFF
ncbi:MAG TPA: MlaD family protein [Longimicrobiales bacterium]|nr:MlaD family protein [Longimicrobiales bacterium]